MVLLTIYFARSQTFHRGDVFREAGASRRGSQAGAWEPVKAHSCEEKAMTVYERTVAKMQRLPEPLLQEVSDFVDFLLVKQDQTQWELWTNFREALDLAESDFSDYLRNLETYEEGLARGDVRW